MIEFARGGARPRREEYAFIVIINTNVSLGGSRYARPKRTDNRLVIDNLSVDVSWQVPSLV